ncbi:MAG: YdcF family protein, partial [Endozoicomonas sp.]
LGIMILYLMSTQPVSSFLIRSLERYPVFEVDKYQLSSAQAIVILGGGLPRPSPEMSGFRPSTYTLERLRYGAWLQKQTSLPILVSGGGYRPEAEVMAQSLSEDFGIEPKWLEDQSINTWENALYSRQILPNDITSVIVVTHGWHMARAVYSYEKLGFHVIPAPGMLNEQSNNSFSLQRWIPGSKYLMDSERAIREYIGSWWYRLVYRE